MNPLQKNTIAVLSQGILGQQLERNEPLVVFLSQKTDFDPTMNVDGPTIAMPLVFFHADANSSLRSSYC